MFGVCSNTENMERTVTQWYDLEPRQWLFFWFDILGKKSWRQDWNLGDIKMQSWTDPQWFLILVEVSTKYIKNCHGSNTPEEKKKSCKFFMSSQFEFPFANVAYNAEMPLESATTMFHMNVLNISTIKLVRKKCIGNDCNFKEFFCHFQNNSPNIFLNTGHMLCLRDNCWAFVL